MEYDGQAKMNASMIAEKLQTIWAKKMNYELEYFFFRCVEILEE